MKLTEFEFLYNGEYLKTTIPSVVHMDLMKNDIINEPFFSINEDQYQWIDKLDWEYKCEFEIENLEKNKKLIFHGVDTFSTILVNNREVLKTDNMFLKYEIDVTEFLTIGKNILTVLIDSPIKKGIEIYNSLNYKLPAINDRGKQGEVEYSRLLSPFMRKAPYHFGWDWGPRFVTSGIYKEVELIDVEEIMIEDIYFENIKIENDAHYKCNLEINSLKDAEVECNIFVDGKKVNRELLNLTSGINNITTDLIIENCELWWPNGHGNQKLYNIEIEVNSLVYSKRLGVRKIKFINSKDRYGKQFRFEVNGKDIFIKGANHIPNDLFIPRITKEVYETEIEQAVFANFNMLRLWGGGYYEHDYFYDLCDEKGILIWQDFMFACAAYPNEKFYLDSVEEEAIYQVKRLRNHACLAMFCGNNEVDEAWSKHYGWGWMYKQQYDNETRKHIENGLDAIFLKILRNAVNTFAPNIKYVPTSPYSDSDDYHKLRHLGDDHYWWPMHSGLPFENYLTTLSRFSSEYGFRSLPNYNCLQDSFNKEELYLKSDALIKRERVMDGYKLVEQFTSEFIDEAPKTLPEYVHYSQVGQGLCLLNTILNYRLNSQFTKGSLYWQFNDTWTTPGWATINYDGSPKLSQYFVKDAYANSQLVLKNVDEFTYDLFYVNDESFNHVLDLKCEIVDYNKVVIDTFNIDETVNAEDVLYLYTRKHCDYPAEKKYYLRVTGMINDTKYYKIIILHKLEIKKLKQPNIEYTMNGNTLEVISSEFAPYVGINFKGDGYLVENAINLEKNEPRIINIIGEITDITFDVIGG